METSPPETLHAVATREGADSNDQPAANALPVSYRITIEPLHNRKLLQVVFIFDEPEHLRGIEAFHFTMSHTDSGVFSRKIESGRKKIAP
jgi:hypothetical protein